MITLGKYTNAEILPYIGPGRPKITLATKDNVYDVKVSSVRMQCLKRSQECVRCRCKGTIWLLQSHVVQAPRVSHNCFIQECPWCCLKRGNWTRPQKVGTPSAPHLNLYQKGSRGLILMTQDHIFPKHAGGSDGLKNMQTMCQVCNSYKGGMLPDEYEKVMSDHERNQYARQVARGSLGPKGLLKSPEHDPTAPYLTNCAAE